MRKSRIPLGIAVLGTALACACADNGPATKGSGGSGGSSFEASGSGGEQGTGGGSDLGGATGGRSGSGGAVTSGGSSGDSSAAAGAGETGGSIGSGGSIGTGGVLGSGGVESTFPPTGGCCASLYCPNGDTFVSSCPAGASCYQFIACNCNQVLCARGGTGGATGGTGDATGTTGGMTRTGGATGGTAGSTGGATGGGVGGTGGAASTGGLPALHVDGKFIRDPNGKTIVLRGSSLIDIGALYAYGGNSVAGISARMDKLAAAGVQGHLVRMPVYPKIDYNGGGSYCSPLPYPVGGTGSANCTPTAPMTAADYVSKVLKPAVDYAASKNLYAIIDHHQIDNATTGNSAADAKTFWTDVAPKFASYANVIYEPFNEPIDGSASWATFKPVVQGWIDTIRAGAPDNIIIVPSMSYDQHPGDAASDAPRGTNLAYTAHVYPGNWSTSFKAQVTTAVAKAPVFITEWGYVLNGSDKNLGTASTTWGTDFEALVDGNGASWTAWVTDNSWTPNMFSNSAFTTLSDFGTVVKNWLAAKASSDWVQ